MYTVHIRFTDRINRIQKALEDKHFDVLIGTRLKTVTHASGVFCPWRSAVVIPADGEIYLISLGIDLNRLRFSH